MCRYFYIRFIDFIIKSKSVILTKFLYKNLKASHLKDVLLLILTIIIFLYQLNNMGIQIFVNRLKEAA